MNPLLTTILLLAVAVSSVASDAPVMPNTQTVSGEVLFQETVKLLRQGAENPGRLEAPLRGLPVEVILRNLDRPESIWKGKGKEIWFYPDEGGRFCICIVVRAGRLESITYQEIKW